MVDALHEIHRVLRAGGLLVDARPDSRVLVKVLSGGRVAGTLATQADTLIDDRTSDRAVARVKRERLFRSLGSGRLWHPVSFEGVSELNAYLRDHLRLGRRVRWRIGPAERRRIRSEPVTTLRAIRYELLRRG